MDKGQGTAFVLSVPALRGKGHGGLCTVGRRSVGYPSRTPPGMHAAPQGKGRYWPGEWICVDCGYVYKPGRRIKFEDLPGAWKCPQCNAPKRRFAKKAGSVIQETAGTSNTPIIVFSLLGLVATVLFGVWASTQL